MQRPEQHNQECVWPLAKTPHQYPEKAFERLYNLLWAKLLAVAFNFVRDKATAQEIVQDVFVSLWMKRDVLREVDDVTAFAMRSIRNRIYDHFDSKAVRDRYIHQLSNRQTEPVNYTERQVEYNEAYHIIDAEIDMLPDTTQKIFRLSRFERFTNEEIATRQQVSVKAVEYHITQALKHLRLKLKYIVVVMLQVINFPFN